MLFKWMTFKNCYTFGIEKLPTKQNVLDNDVVGETLFHSGQILTVGSDYPAHNYVELMTIKNSSWSTMEQYPYGNEISRYAMVNFKENFIMFGGLSHGWVLRTLSTVVNYV